MSEGAPGIVLALGLAFWPKPAGGLTQHDLAQVVSAPAAGAALPLTLRFVDQAGATLTLAQALGGRPAVLVFADYTCRTLCGPGLVLTALALDQTRLVAGRDYSFVAVGIDPRDGPAEARRMAGRLHAGAGRAAELLSEGPADKAAAALGYRYLYDSAVGQYAHDTSVYVLSPQGRVLRMLPEFALTPAALSSALTRPDPPARLLPEPLRLICYCLAPLTGVFDRPAELGLRVSAVGFVAACALAFLFLRRRGERRA